MVKAENAPFHKNHKAADRHTAISDYPALISDECVRLADAKVLLQISSQILVIHHKSITVLYWAELYPSSR